MSGPRLRWILAAAALVVAASALHGPTSAHVAAGHAGDRRGSSALVATVDVVPVSQLTEPRDDGSNGRAQAMRGPVLLLALVVVLVEAARRGRRTARPYRLGARHRSERWMVALRGPPVSFS